MDRRAPRVHLAEGRSSWTPSTPTRAALAYAYDIVCNGNEIGGGSIRIHRADVQQRVFDVMGLSPEEAQEKFGFLLEAFKYGPPPHGGIAFGWDRICALLAGTDSIREVIAFPKTGGGYDPLTGAPAPITAEQRKEAGIALRAAGQLSASRTPGPATRAPARRDLAARQAAGAGGSGGRNGIGGRRGRSQGPAPSGLEPTPRASKPRQKPATPTDLLTKREPAPPQPSSPAIKPIPAPKGTQTVPPAAPFLGGFLGVDALASSRAVPRA